MSRYLILAEKASAMRSFAKDLGGNSGTLPSGDDYAIVHAHGHLLGLDAPERQWDDVDYQQHVSKWSDITTIPWKLDRFKWVKTYLPTKDMKGHKTTTRKQVQQIASFAKNFDAVIIATDNDPSGEGDVLGQEIVEAMGWSKPVYRLVFDDEHNAAEIKKALTKLVDVTNNSKSMAYQKGLARERFDYATMQASRLATHAARNYNYDSVIRPGRLKSVITEKLYQQTRKRDQFVPKDQFQAIFVDENGTKFTNSKMTKYDQRDLAENDVRNLKVSTVTVDQTKRKHGHAPKLMDFAQVAIALPGASATAVKNTYQKLYEAGFASYPRTEDRAMTKSQWDQLGAIADDIAKVIGIDPKTLTQRDARSPYVSNKDLVHGCNRPGLTVPTSLNDLKAQFGTLAPQIYEVLARSYLATLAPDYEYDATTAFVTDFPAFTAHKNVPVKPGYKAVLGDLESAGKSSKTKEDNETAGQFGKQAKPQVNVSKTTAPQKPSRKFIFNYLAKENVGTGATRLGTFAQLSSGKKPLFKEGRGGLKLTPEGFLAGAMLQNTMLASPKITKQLTEMMDQIGEHKIPMTNIYKAVTMILQKDRQTMEQNAKLLDKDSYLKGKLPAKSGNSANKVKVKLPNGKEVAFKNRFMDHEFNENEVKALSTGQTIKIKVTTKYGPKMVSGRLTQQSFIGKDKKKVKYWGFKVSSWD